MELYFNEQENILGEIIKKNDDGSVVVDFAGTILTLPESENEIVMFAGGGRTREQNQKIRKVMGEFHDGKLYTSYGSLVTDAKQAYAIAASEAGISKYNLGGKLLADRTKVGREITLRLPNGETRRAAFALVDADDIIASHNHNTFYSSEGYPVDENGDNINDRNYKDDPNLQNAVIEYAANLEPERLVTTSRTPSGTPIVNKDGIVVSGNNRTMSLKRAMIMHPANYAEYKQYLAEEIGAFGFSPDDLSRYRNPILVRIDYDIPELNTLEMSKYNKATQKGESPIDKAIKIGKQLAASDRCKEVIAEIVGNYETFSEFYVNFSDQKKLLQTLIDCNILTKQETTSYFYERGFTEAGKELIENLLAGLVLNKESLIITNDVARKLRQIIITSLPVLSANSTLGNESLIPALNEAISIESKMKTSGLDFTNWINQLSMFDERPAAKALYMNRLINSGRNTFKQSIERYNEAVKNSYGAGLFGDAPTPEEIFEGYIVSKLPKETVDLIQNMNDKTTVSEQIVLSEKVIPKAEKMIQGNPFADSNYFKEYPENILARQESGIDRWKKPFTKYVGSIEDLSRIVVPENLQVLLKAENPVLSVVETPVVEKTDKDMEVIDNLDRAIKASAKDITKKQTRKTREKMVNAESESENKISSVLETYTLKEVYHMDNLNEKITTDDLRAFLWYQDRKGRTINNPEWYEIADTTLAELQSNKFVNEWVKQGVLFYQASGSRNELDYLVPAYEYLSGNVYEKYNQLVVSELSENVGGHAEHIIKTYGKDVYDRQVMELTAIFQRKYDQRLVIKSEGDETGLKLLPTSKFARNFYISTLLDEMPFKWKKVTAKSNKYFGMPDFLATNFSDWDKKEFETLSLTNAFQLWLRTDRTIAFKQGVNYAIIIEYYFQNKPKPRSEVAADDMSARAKAIRAAEDAAHERMKARAKSEGDRLFAIFLDKMLTLNDRVRLETEWNMKFNNNVGIDYNRIPVAFRMNKFINGQPLDVRPEKREAVAFTLAQGSGLLAYDVGVGKTPSAIFTVSTFIDMGYSLRPLIIVPNQTYKQWISEFNSFCGHLQINGLYNLSDQIINEWTDENGNIKPMPEQSVTIITYEGMKKIGFNEQTISEMENGITKILSQDTSDLTDKQAQREIEKTNTKVAELIGKSLAKTAVSFEDFGFDYVCLDEAHAAKKVFTNVAGEAEEHLGDSSKKTRAVQSYKIQSGTPSAVAIKAFVITQYIQKKYQGNTQLLTATPFTNSPLEVYSMLSMIAHNKLVEMGLENLNAFFDTFIEVSYELVINAKLNPERRQIILGFNNLLVLQQLIKRFINHKTGESVNVQRPNKIVLPLKNKLVDGLLVPLPEDQQVDSVLPLSDIQKEYMAAIKQYAEGTISEEMMCAGASLNEEDIDEDSAVAEGIELDENSLDEDEKTGVRLLKAMNHARNLALSPYLFDCAGLGKPTAKSYIETSNKLKYVMESIKSIKNHHEKTNTPMSGVVIYIERGVEHFPLIREYLIDVIGFKPHEVGIISSKLKTPAPSMPDEAKKEYVKNLFLGKKFNEQTGDFEKLSDADRMKVLIGSATIKEGINLQAYSSTLFNCFLPWNPTDVQQMEGRIYRQGNAFNNVRIVNPLMIDSIDVFMFQKLEEKTSRINSVWETDGSTNVLKTEEFNPKELKYSLIKDARVIAQMELLEEKEKMDERKADLENQTKRIISIKNSLRVISTWESDYRKWLSKYRPADAQKPLENALKSGQIVLKKQTDENGLPMVYSWTRDQVKYDENNEPIQYSPLDPASKQHYFDDLVLAVRQVSRFERDVLVPTGRKIEQIDDLVAEIAEALKNHDELSKELMNEESIKLKTEEIIRKREALMIKEKTFDQVVDEFDRLNYLLDDVKLPDVKKIVETECPVVDANGMPRIDLEAIRLMDECTKRQVQTRDLHSKKIEVDGEVKYEYTAERKKLHDRIYEEMTKNAVCITQEQPIAILMGGAPGSGKSSFLKKNAEYMTSDKIWKVDTDEVREFLPEYEGWNAGATHEEAAMITNRLLSNYDKPCKHDLLYDGTMKNARKYIPIIKQLKADGYKVFIAYMEIPKEISIERAMGRYRNNKGGKTKYGRYVPLFVIEEFFQTGDELFQQIKTMVDGYIKVDSMTGNIIEKGGESIPKDRSYYRVFEKSETTPEIAKLEPEKEKQTADLKGALESLKILYKYATGDQKKKLKGAMDSLKILLKYAK